MAKTSLLFFNRKLKRLVAVDLKQGSFRAEYKGHMELYLRWLAKYEREEDEGTPLGIILCAGASTRQVDSWSWTRPGYTSRSTLRFFHLKMFSNASCKMQSSLLNADSTSRRRTVQREHRLVHLRQATEEAFAAADAAELRRMVLISVPSDHSKRNYAKALDKVFALPRSLHGILRPMLENDHACSSGR